MHYTQFFRRLREEKQLGQEELAAMAGRHRNTVINVESARPVRFKTIAELMKTMGYGPGSEPLRQIALLWLEDVSGLSFSTEEAAAASAKIKSAYRAAMKEPLSDLQQAIEARGLSREEIQLLQLAAENPEMLDVLGAIRDLINKKVSAEDRNRNLFVAEDQ